MPIGESIAGFVLEVLAQTVIYEFFSMFFKACRSIFRWLAHNLLGISFPNAEFERTKRIYELKRVVLSDVLYDVIPKGTQGVVLEVIDENKVFAEFELANGVKISIGDQTVFEVALKKLALVRVRSSRRYRRR